MGEMQWKTKFQIDRAAKWAGKRATEVSSACQQCRRVGDAVGNKRVGEDTDEITDMKRHSTPSNAARHHRWPKRVMVREKERKSSISLRCFSFSAPQCFLLSRSFFFLFLKSQLAFYAQCLRQLVGHTAVCCTFFASGTGETVVCRLAWIHRKFSFTQTRILASLCQNTSQAKFIVASRKRKCFL